MKWTNSEFLSFIWILTARSVCLTGLLAIRNWSSSFTARLHISHWRSDSAWLARIFTTWWSWNSTLKSLRGNRRTSKIRQWSVDKKTASKKPDQSRRVTYFGATFCAQKRCIFLTRESNLCQQIGQATPWLSLVIQTDILSKFSSWNRHNNF